jgi:hypothetical protein
MPASLLDPVPAPVKGSPAFRLDATDIKKILTGLAITVLGSVLSYLATQVLPHVQADAYPMLIPAASLVVNAGLKFVRDNSAA